MKTSKIGIFDSGFGGLSVLYEAFRLGLEAKFIYYADNLNAPYGTKKADEIIKLSNNILEFFEAKNIDASVIACNTASSVFSKDLRANFDFPIIAMEPAIKKANDLYPNKKISVIATILTTKGAKLKKLIALQNNPNIGVFAPQKLVEFAQNLDFSKAQNYLKENFEAQFLETEILVLGCTHFNFFKSDFKALNPNIKFIDGNYGTLKNLAKKANLKANQNKLNLDDFIKNSEFFISGKKADSKQIEQITALLYRLQEEYNQ